MLICLVYLDYPSCCLGKVKVESIDDEEEMQIMDEAFDILGFKWYVQLERKKQVK